MSPSSNPRGATLRYGLAALALGGVACAVAWAASQASPRVDPAPEEAGLPVATLRWEPCAAYVTTHAFTGRLRARRRSALGFERPGRLIEVLVREGDAVAEGQVLARLDPAAIDARAGEAEARLSAAKARLSELEAGPRREEIASAEAQVRELEARLALARLTQGRQEGLQDEGVASAEGLDQARSGLGVAAAQLERARQQLQLLEQGTRAEELSAQRAQVAAQAAQVQTLKVELAQATIRAPFPGRISQVSADPGVVLAAGTPVVSLSERGALEAWVGVPPGPLAALEPGSAQLLLVEGVAYPARVRGRLPELDPATRTGTVVLELAEEEGLLPEQIVRLVLPRTLPGEGAGWVPISALVRGERELWSCLVLSEGQPRRVERRLVEVLHTEPERALVRGSLVAGDELVATGVHRLVPGQAVRAR